MEEAVSGLERDVVPRVHALNVCLAAPDGHAWVKGSTNPGARVTATATAGHGRVPCPENLRPAIAVAGGAQPPSFFSAGNGSAGGGVSFTGFGFASTFFTTSPSGTNGFGFANTTGLLASSFSRWRSSIVFTMSE